MGRILTLRARTARAAGPLLLVFAFSLSTFVLPAPVRSAAAPAAGDLVRGGGFEGPFGETGLADGWLDNSSWANLDVRYAPEKANPRSGTLCQRVTCDRLVYGAVQVIPASSTPIRKGTIYRVRAWLRGNVGPVAIQLRQAPSPYRVYVEKSLAVSDAWREVSYFWTATLDDPECRLMIRFTAMGTLWVDDVSVEEVSPEEARRALSPPGTGNLLPNGGFDLGTAHWLVGHGCDYWREADLQVVGTKGDRCLRLSVPERVGVTLSSEVVPLAQGHPVALVARLRAEKPVKLTLGGRFCRKSVDLTTEWQTVTALGTVGFTPDPYDYVYVQLVGPAEVWLDDVQIRQDGRTEGGDRPVAAVIADRHPLALYHDGERPFLRILSRVPASEEPPELAWQVEDFWGKARLSGTWRPGPGRQERRIACSSLTRGWYRARVSWSEGRLARQAECTFALLPPRERKGDARTSPFGAHFAVDASGLKLARAVGVRWLRLHPPNHTKWRVVEAEQGKWTWRDDPIRLARKAGLELCGSLDRIPRWASTAPPGTSDAFYTGWSAWLPRDWSDWERYVAETVRRYRSEIRVWEVWNEPNLTDWLVPPDDRTRAQAYVEMLRHTTPIVRREDPGATVIGGCVAGALQEKSPALRFAEEIIDLGALPLMDVFSFHDYIGASVDEGGDPIQAWLPRLRERMRAAGRELPVLNSEGGFSNPGTCLSNRPCEGSTVPPDKMARWLVRQYVAQLAQGVRQFYFYNFFINGSPFTREWEGFVEGDGQPRPNVAAYATMTWLLDGATFERTDQPDADTWVHRFRTPRGRLGIAWTRTGATASLTVPAGSKAWDLMGAPVAVPASGKLAVTDAPVYVLERR